MIIRTASAEHQVNRSVRTISTVDDLVIEQAKQRTESWIYEGAPGSKGAPSSVDLESSAEAAALEQSNGQRDPSIFQRKDRRNTSNTVFVQSTMSNPDTEATINCVCTVIRAHMVDAAAEAEQTPEHPKAKIFHDEEFVRSGVAPRVPSLAALVTFFRDMYTKSQMEMECIIMCLVYMERLTKETRGAVQVRSYNWKSIILSTLIMSSKVWDDLSMWNADFSQVCPTFTLKRINELELALLDFLGYNVKVAASDYAKYYFHLRSYCVRLGLIDDLNSLAPLNLTGAKKLEVLSSNYEEAHAGASMKRRCATMPDASSAGEESRRASNPLRTAESSKASLEQV
eukprot:CAMPEP_0172646418 /NCGR_PEP_ID=MMETSP1068-20121228/240231_1 /TAXON_ID=35684 /ORGANISM="Pseudopedinella elastica, Strain CCMP716" /LENGTH=341 /DNA_ID=CAMNT_0013460677 /DNA_START=1 /DNA_END=1023 /DNA_ORIENTATION=+